MNTDTKSQMREAFHKPWYEKTHAKVWLDHNLDGIIEPITGRIIQSTSDMMVLEDERGQFSIFKHANVVMLITYTPDDNQEIDV